MRARWTEAMGGRAPTAVLVLLLVLVAPMSSTAIRIPASFVDFAEARTCLSRKKKQKITLAFPRRVLAAQACSAVIGLCAVARSSTQFRNVTVEGTSISFMPDSLLSLLYARFHWTRKASIHAWGVPVERWQFTGRLDRVPSMMRGDGELKALIDLQYQTQRQNIADAPVLESGRADESTDDERDDDCQELKGFELAHCQRQQFARFLDEQDYPGAHANENVVFAPLPS
ncbi:hypothetical protein R1flu_014746 [Riccia fluitans]|uniref:Uncharacterized protein n=1 Tax=Riccia fluitans TaxID=41844 RepID=A0ABD1YHD4_9MARC